MKYTLRQPACTGCPHDLYFGEAIPKKQFGVMMHCGEHFCTACFVKEAGQEAFDRMLRETDHVLCAKHYKEGVFEK